MTTYQANRIKAKENAKHKSLCASVLLRFNKYRSLHPVTVRGVCELSGIMYHQPVCNWINEQRVSVPEDSLRKIDKYLLERNF